MSVEIKKLLKQQRELTYPEDRDLTKRIAIARENASPHHHSTMLEEYRQEGTRLSELRDSDQLVFEPRPREKHEVFLEEGQTDTYSALLRKALIATGYRSSTFEQDVQQAVEEEFRHFERAGKVETLERRLGVSISIEQGRYSVIPALRITGTCTKKELTKITEAGGLINSSFDRARLNRE